MKIDLSHCVVLVTRPAPKGLQLCQEITALGGKAFHFPTIAFAEPQDKLGFQEAFAQLPEQACWIFISQYAAQATMPMIKEKWPIAAPNLQLAAVGPATGELLNTFHYANSLFPSEHPTTEGFLALPYFQSIKGKKIAIIRGVDGRPTLASVLRERGAEVLEVIAYQRVQPSLSKMETLQQLEKINGL